MKRFGDLPVRWLQSFVAVAENGKRTAAGATLGINQSTATRHVQHLEKWLGGQVLLDSGVPANLYPAGERFLPVAKEVLRLLEEARQSCPPPTVATVPDAEA